MTRILALIAIVGLGLIALLAATLPENASANTGLEAGAGRPAAKGDRDANQARDLPSPMPTRPSSKAADRSTVGSAGAPTTDTSKVVLHGLLREDGGEQIVVDEANVGLQPIGSQSWLRASARSGSYAFSGLEPGGYVISAWARGFAPHRQRIELQSSSPVQRVDLLLKRQAKILVKILTPDGKPFPRDLLSRFSFGGSIGVVATSEQLTHDLPPTDARSVHWFGIGEWQPSSVPEQLEHGIAGTLLVTEPPPIWVTAVLRHLVLGSTRFEAGQEAAVIHISPDDVKARLGSVRLRVVDGVTGAPIAGMSVSISDSQSGGKPRNTDTQGAVLFEGLRPGPLMLRLTPPPRYERPNPRIDVPPGKELDLGTIALQPTQHVRGRLVDERGEPVRARVTICRLDPWIPGQGRGDSWGAAVGSEGNFEFQVLGKARYLITANTREKPQVFGYKVVDTRGGSLEDVLVTVRPAALLQFVSKLRVTEQPMVTIRDWQGLVLWQRRMAAGWEFPVPLVPGRYEIEVRHHGAATGQTSRIDIGGKGREFVVR